MKSKLLLFVLLLSTFAFADVSAQTMPLVYSVENTGADVPAPFMPSVDQLPVIKSLPDPFEWADGRGRIKYYSDWRVRRAEIGDQIENYEIGEIPPPPGSITASYSSGVLTVVVTVSGRQLTLTSQVILPSGSGPFPAVIGIMSPSGSIPDSIFTDRHIAEIAYDINEVTTYGSPSTSDPYYQLYPNLNPTNTGQYSAWAWGVSRIIDGLERVQNVLPIDLKHIAVTGCSYAGKLALFAGAFDERIALTIAQESGGGGATSWRYSHTEPQGTVEDIDNTDYNWFRDSMKQFYGDDVYRLPEDHHELMAMVAPRALYVTANPSYIWLSNPSCYVASEGCKQVYDALGIGDRFGYSIVGGHLHCQVPNTQIPEIVKFVDKFLLGEDTVNTSNIADNPYNIDLTPWITWSNPTITTGTSYFGTTSLVSPPDSETDADTTATFTWNKTAAASQYYFQISADPSFKTLFIGDSTTDSSVAVNNLQKGVVYFWRVQVDSADEPGPWSHVWQLTTAIPPPARADLIGAVQDSVNGNYVGFRFSWHKAVNATQYLMQITNDSTFSSYPLSSTTTADTSLDRFGFLPGVKYYWRVQASNVNATASWSQGLSFMATQTAVQEKDGRPITFSLSQNYPNPFNPSTVIKFALAKSAFTTLTVYDVLGREVRTLVDERLGPGYYEVNFNANDLVNGVYFYRIKAGNFTETKKLVLLK